MRIRKKVLLSLLASGILASGVSANTNNSDSTTNYEEKLPYKLKDPVWEKYNHGDEGLWPRPPITSFTVGLVSGASNNAFDYKEKYNNFFSMVEKFKIDGPVEAYYKSNETSPVTMSIPQGSSQGKTLGGDVTLDFTFYGSNVPAYNGITSSNELFLDSSSGQWLVTNHIYSRDNIKGISSNGSTSITSSSLETVPWGDAGVSTFITPEDFLVGLSKSIYGVEESRPMYLQTEPYRLAKKNTWWVYRPPAEPDEPCPIIWRYETGEWKNQDVSYINPAWMDYTPPMVCGEGKRMDWGEYVVNVDGAFGNLWHRYYKDQNSYVSANVYELYFTRLLQKGILPTDTAFANVSNNVLVKETHKSDIGTKENSFSFTPQFGNRFLTEYINYGASPGSKNKLKYPVWAPELEGLYSNQLLSKMEFGDPIINKPVELITHGGNKYYNALGIGYKVEGNSTLGVTSIKKVDNPQIMVKRSVTLIEALRIIERAMRVEDGDMTNTEADIITQKYGAQYLDSLSEKDRRTVSYLLAKGILNFENHQEYSNLYSPLTNSFGYKLIYRIANKESRLKFTEVMLTDSAEIPSKFLSYKQRFLTVDLKKAALLGSISETGKLLKYPGGERLVLTSDIQFSNKSEIIKAKPGSPVQDRHVIKAEIDDPLKYLYRGMPLVNVKGDGTPYQNGNSLTVYTSTEKNIYNDIDETKGRYVGIKSIMYKPNTKRYTVTFYVYGDNYKTAVQFIKANLETRINNISTAETTAGVKSKSGANLNTKPTKDVANEVKSNNDIKTNTDVGATAYIGDGATIAGNTVVVGESSTKIESNSLSSMDILDKLSQKAGYENIGQKSLVTIAASQAKAINEYPILTSSGKKLGSADIIREKVSSAESTKGKGDISLDFTGINISQNDSADVLIYDTKFTFKAVEGGNEKDEKNARDPDKTNKPKLTEREVTGSIVVSWTLDLPNNLEQAAMVGSNLSPTINDNAKSGWIFTKPTNKDLLSIWNYNEGINNALLKTITKKDLRIKSGYFSPQITILVDSLNRRQITHEGKIENLDLTELQLAEIQNSFLTEVGKNLDSGWIQTYIGSVALANYTVGEPTSNKAITKYITKNNIKDEETPSLTIKPDSKYLSEVKIAKGLPVWAGLVFGQEKDNSTAATYFRTHAWKTSFNMETIYTISNGYKFYGEYSHLSGEGMYPYLDIPYARDEFGNIYMNEDISDYKFNKERLALIQSDGTSGANREGSVVTFKDAQYTIQNDTPNHYDLYSNKALVAIVKNNDLYLKDDKGSNTKIYDAIHGYNTKTFGSMNETGLNGNHYMRTQAFNFAPTKNLITPGSKFAGINEGKMITYEYKIYALPNPTYKVEPAKANEGDLVYVTPYVTLSKHVWSVEGSTLKWGKKFLGADPAMYIKGTLVQSLKEQILPKDSKNIVNASAVKEGTLNIGNITGKLNGNKATFLVPYNSSMIKDGKISNDAVIQKFNDQGDLVLLPSNSTASSTQFITNKEVGAYDATFKGYKNTLVNNKGKLQVADGTKLVDYTSSSVVDTISLTGMVMDGLRFLNYGPSGGEGMYKIYQYQEVRPPSTIAPFTDGAPPVPNTSGSQILEVASKFEGLSTANELFDSLQKELRRLAVENTWLFLVYLVLTLCLFLSVTTLLAHAFAHTPISNVFFSRVHDVISIDLLALMSIGTVRIDGDEPNNWIRTVKTSFFLGVIPIMIFGLLQIFDLI